MNMLDLFTQLPKLLSASPILFYSNQTLNYSGAPNVVYDPLKMYDSLAGAIFIPRQGVYEMSFFLLNATPDMNPYVGNGTVLLTQASTNVNTPTYCQVIEMEQGDKIYVPVPYNVSGYVSQAFLCVMLLGES